MDKFQHFLQMGGYAAYIWTAYGIVLMFLFLQWLLTWHRRNKLATHE